MTYSSFAGLPVDRQSLCGRASVSYYLGGCVLLLVYGVAPLCSVGSALLCFMNAPAVFKRLRKTAKSDYWLRHVCPSVSPNGTRLPVDGF